MKCRHCNKPAKYKVYGTRGKTEPQFLSFIRAHSIPVCQDHLRLYPKRRKGFTERLFD